MNFARGPGEKIHFEDNLCYLAFGKTMRLQKEELRRDRPLVWKVPKPFFLTAVGKAAA